MSAFGFFGRPPLSFSSSTTVMSPLSSLHVFCCLKSKPYSLWSTLLLFCSRVTMLVLCSSFVDTNCSPMSLIWLCINLITVCKLKSCKLGLILELPKPTVLVNITLSRSNSLCVGTFHTRFGSTIGVLFLTLVGCSRYGDYCLGCSS